MGLIIGLIRFVMEFAFTIPACGGESHSATTPLRSPYIDLKSRIPKALKYKRQDDDNVCENKAELKNRPVNIVLGSSSDGCVFWVFFMIFKIKDIDSRLLQLLNKIIVYFITSLKRQKIHLVANCPPSPLHDPRLK